MALFLLNHRDTTSYRSVTRCTYMLTSDEVSSDNTDVRTSL